MRAILRLCILLLPAILISACSHEPANSVALVVQYMGPTDKYVPCLILSDEAQSHDAVVSAGKIGCQPFASLIATTADRRFSAAVDAVENLPQTSAEHTYLEIVMLSTVGAEQHRKLDLSTGLPVVQGVAQYFPTIRSRIEQEFVHRFKEGSGLATQSGRVQIGHAKPLARQM